MSPRSTLSACTRIFDYEGNGIYRQWHYNYRYGKITRHLGSVDKAPFALTWRTDWIPDQDRPIQVVARIRDTAGTYYMTDVVDDLVLTRPHRSVVLYKPYDVPGHWVARRASNNQHNHVFIPHDLDPALAAQLILTTWSGGHADAIGVNDIKVVPRVGLSHDYSYDEVAVPLELLRPGTNQLFTHSITPQHGIEVLWPGIALKVQYEGQPNAAATIGEPDLFTDALATGWRLGEVSRVTVDLEAETPTYQGRFSIGLQNSGTQDWTVELRRDAPLDVAGYGSLRLALLFEDLIVRDPKWLLLDLNDHSPLSLLAADRQTGGVELDHEGWQIIEIPFDEIPLRPLYIESLKLRGRFAGRFFIDDVGLVAKASTHIADIQPGMPPATQLLPGYPNPFNGEPRSASSFP